MDSVLLRQLIRTPRRWWHHGLLTAEVGGATRSAVAMALAWCACLAVDRPDAALIAATTAQNVALLHVRGDYRARGVILVLLIVVISTWVLVGAIAGAHVVAASLCTALLALSAGAWRQASGDYGPHFALAPALLFFLSLSQPGDWHHGLAQLVAALCGGAIGLVTQIAVWWVRPQHALRHAVAEAWVSTSDLLESLPHTQPRTDPAIHSRVERENALRATVDRSLRALQAGERAQPILVAHLDDLTQLAARLATRALAFHTAVEPLRARPDFTNVDPALTALWRDLVDVTRSAALAVISHRRAHAAALDVRLRRAQAQIQVLDTHLSTLPGTEASATRSRELLRLVGELLPVLRSGVDRTIDHGSNDITESLRLPDLRGRSLRTLSAWINPPTQIDPILVRYSLRIGLLMTAAIAAYRGFDIPRGYWIAFTILVVLQPDYGGTRQKAAQRIAGTVAGGLVGSLLLWVHLPIAFHVFATSALAFGFAYHLRRRYALAVFYVTLMIVIMTEAMIPVHLDFTIARMVATIVGGGLSLLAALVLWPKWEHERAPSILAAALRANRRYLEVVAARLVTGEPFAGPAVQAKREAERANSRATASLQRRLGEPAHERGDTDRATALTAYNRRLTHAITLLGQHRLPEPLRVAATTTSAFAPLVQTLDTLAEATETNRAIELPGTSRTTVDAVQPEAVLVHGQIAAIANEIAVMAHALRTAPRS